MEGKIDEGTRARPGERIRRGSALPRSNHRVRLVGVWLRQPRASRFGSLSVFPGRCDRRLRRRADRIAPAPAA